MKQASEGISESIALTLNKYDLDEESFDYLYNEAVSVFNEYVLAHTPKNIWFDIATCRFLNNDGTEEMSFFPEYEQEELLHAAEAAADEWIAANA